MNSNKPMDWEWIKSFPEALKAQFKSMKNHRQLGESPAGGIYRVPRRAAAAIDCRADPLALAVAA